MMTKLCINKFCHKKPQFAKGHISRHKVGDPDIPDARKSNGSSEEPSPRRFSKASLS